MSYLDLAPIKSVSGSVLLPGSKSISNRSLLLAALARGATELTGLLDADDVDRMCESLRTLGVRIEAGAPGETAIVHGVAGVFPVRRASLFLGNIPNCHGDSSRGLELFSHIIVNSSHMVTDLNTYCL